MIPTGKPTSIVPKGLLLVSSTFQKDFFLARNALVSSLALAGAPIRIALVSSPYFAGVIPLGVPVSVQLQRHLRYVIVHCIVVKSVPLRQR